MGDRANVAIKYAGHEKPVYLYTHWSGTELAAIVQKAIERGTSRWDDESYLARIIFCDMVKGRESELTGFGISPYICDNEHPIIEVNPESKTVTFSGGESYSFEDYVILGEPELTEAYHGANIPR